MNEWMNVRNNSHVCLQNAGSRLSQNVAAMLVSGSKFLATAVRPEAPKL